MNWRPAGWKNPPIPDLGELGGCSCNYGAYLRAYEAGADAILEALTASGWHVETGEHEICWGSERLLPPQLKGWLEAIPGEVMRFGKCPLEGPYLRAYEAGATAMLEALKASGWNVETRGT